jgi:hypothetical protein
VEDFPSLNLLSSGLCRNCMSNLDDIFYVSSIIYKSSNPTGYNYYFTLFIRSSGIIFVEGPGYVLTL